MMLLCTYLAHHELESVVIIIIIIVVSIVIIIIHTIMLLCRKWRTAHTEEQSSGTGKTLSVCVCTPSAAKQMHL